MNNQRELKSGSTGQHEIQVIDAPGAGGACQAYVILGLATINQNPSYDLLPLQFRPNRRGIGILFQNGNPAETDANGVHMEDLLAILIDRLEGFQAGPAACLQNADALTYCKEALAALDNRSQFGPVNVDDQAEAESIPTPQPGDTFVSRINDTTDIPTGSIGEVEEHHFPLPEGADFSVVFESLGVRGVFNLAGELIDFDGYPARPGNAMGDAAGKSEGSPSSDSQSTSTGTDSPTPSSETSSVPASSPNQDTESKSPTTPDPTETGVSGMESLPDVPPSESSSSDTVEEKPSGTPTSDSNENSSPEKPGKKAPAKKKKSS